uniref:Uncharacterized protein n=1 Tax=Echinococcus canadensis TaxID=519352 RepID=A0A915EVY1_9CEST
MRPDYTSYAEFPNDSKPMLCSIVINALDSALIAEIIFFAEDLDACKNDEIDHGWLPYVNSCLTKKELKLLMAKLIHLYKRDLLQILCRFKKWRYIFFDMQRSQIKYNITKVLNA